MEEKLLSVNDLKHYAYCEAIVYIEYVLGIKEPVTEYMDYGGNIERDKSLAPIVSKLKVAKIIKKPTLTSRVLELTGSPDYVLQTKTNELIPLEIKWSEPYMGGKPKKDHVIQIAAYALLLEKKIKRPRYSVKRGIIYYLRPAGKLVIVNIDYDLKKEVIKAIKSIKDIINGRREPRANRKKCSSCNFYNFCSWRKERFEEKTK